MVTRHTCQEKRSEFYIHGFGGRWLYLKTDNELKETNLDNSVFGKSVCQNNHHSKEPMTMNCLFCQNTYAGIQASRINRLWTSLKLSTWTGLACKQQQPSCKVMRSISNILIRTHHFTQTHWNSHMKINEDQLWSLIRLWYNRDSGCQVVIIVAFQPEGRAFESAQRLSTTSPRTSL